jgi:hypothetical protein
MLRAVRPFRSPLVLAVFAAAAVVSADPAVAQLSDPTFELGLSYYQPSFDTTVRLDSATLGTGSDLNLEDDLGVEGDASELRGELSIRLGGRFRLVFDHVEFQRSGQRTLGRSIQFGDVVYASNAELRSEVESSHTGGALQFLFYKGPSSDWSVSLGVSYLDVSASISGRAIATANGVPVGTVDIAETGEASGPVPLAGLHGKFWLGQRLRLRLDGRYIDVGALFDEDKWSGSMTEYGASVDYFVLPWLALGGGWAGTAIDADFDDGDDIGSVEYDFDGFLFTATAAF